jgi:hypothetical protein
MRIAIMQPYFLPYIGYYQLIRAVDVFIIYDNIKYTKKGWINRNRMLQNGKDVLFSLPLKNDSDFLNVCEREVAADFRRDKLLNQFKDAYRNAPYFTQTFPLIEAAICHQDRNLFRFLFYSLVETCRHLGLTTEIRISSDVAIDHELRNQDKVLALCAALGADVYVNSIGGLELYSKESFQERGLELKFLRSDAIAYTQFGDPFVPWLSIIDVLMFNPVDTVCQWISSRYQLI